MKNVFLIKFSLCHLENGKRVYSEWENCYCVPADSYQKELSYYRSLNLLASKQLKSGEESCVSFWCLERIELFE